MSRYLSDENAHNLSEITISFLIFTSIYLIIYSRRTSLRIKQKAAYTIRLKRQELGVKIVSIFHAIYTSYGANLCLQQFGQNFSFYSKNDSSIHFANVSAGFFIADLILCIILIEEHGIEFVIHALCALTGSIYVSMSGIGHQYFLNLLLFESSTPFLHIRFLLIEYGYGKTLIAKLNNLIFLLTFAYFRLYLGIPIIIKMCYNLIIEKPLSISMIGFFIMSGIAMTILNIYWFIKIVKNAIKSNKIY